METQPTENRHYKNPPIVEAVINIVVAFPEGGLTDKVLESASRRFAPQFAHTGAIGGINVTIGPIDQPSVQPVTSQAIRGLRFGNEKNNRILQIRSEGFAYSHLKPYTSWETLRHEAEPLWREFVAACGPTKATRLAVKFINQLVFSNADRDDVKLERFLKVHPQVPDSFGPITGFMSQVQVPLPQLSGQNPQALVTVASQPPAPTGSQAAVLDIDVFQGIDLDPSNPRIWDELEKMRTIKNTIFEASISNLLRETFS